MPILIPKPKPKNITPIKSEVQEIAVVKSPEPPKTDNNALVLDKSVELVEGREKKFYWIDATVLNSIELCGQLTQYNHRLNLRLPNPDEIMENGSFIHDLLQLHYLLMRDGSRKYNQIIEEVADYGRKSRQQYALAPEAADFCVNNYISYAGFYAQDGWNPLEIEATFSKVFYENEEMVIVATGVIDLITEVKDRFTFTNAVVDHKSYYRWKQPIQLNNQLMMYSWATEIRRVIFNKVGFQASYTGKNLDKRYRRVQFLFTQNNIDVWERHSIYWAKEGIKYENSGFWPRNYTSCDKFRGCRYVDLCNSNEDIVEFKMKAQFIKGKPWDPSKKEENKKLPVNATDEDTGVEE